MRACFLLLTVAFTAAACGVPKEEHDKSLADLRASLEKKSAEELAADKEACENARKSADEIAKAATQKAETELSATKKALGECTATGGNSAKALAACSIEKEETRQRLERVSASVNKVRDALKAMQDAGKLQVKMQRGFLVIALAGDILFDSGKAKLKDDAKPILLELGNILKSMPDRLFQVAGHTDNAGAEDLNWKLSMERALTVVQFLIKDGGVSGNNLSAGGYAMYQPVADNSTDAGKQTNRRVEFLLMPNLNELLNLQGK